MYNVDSPHAEDFINDEEILDTLKYAAENKSNRPIIESILEKAKLCKGLTHREASFLLECYISELNEKIKNLAK